MLDARFLLYRAPASCEDLTVEKQNETIDPNAALNALAVAFKHLEDARAFLPSGDRATVCSAKVQIGTLMEGLLDFILDDDREDAEESDECNHVESAGKHA